ncbi:Zn-dependent exopeptidase [Xylariaceae sp. FL0804]|nr:Zn-dependent exopeptidase [Xylariaceae sp. FL0804]
MKLPIQLGLLLLTSFRVLGSELQKPLGTHSELTSSSSSAPSYRADLLSLHKSLVQTPSVTYDENEVGEFLAKYLTTHGFVTERQFAPRPNASSAAAPRFNVLAWPGPDRHPAPRVLVTSHIDTVPPFIPYSRSDDGKVHGETLIAGRGSVDAKASVAAQIIAVRELLDSRSVARAGDVMLLFVVGEERGGDGMRVFSDSRDAAAAGAGAADTADVWDRRAPVPAAQFEAAIFGEPTEGRLACGHKGYFACDVTAHGHAGHSGYPWLGKSATETLMRGLVRVLDADLGSSDAFGNTTVNVGTLEGGVAGNVIPERAVAQIAGRVAIGPETDGGRIAGGRAQAILNSVDKDAFEIDCAAGYGAVKCDCDVEGFESMTVNYGTDIPNLKGNHTRYLFGPGSILVAHGPDEAIKVKDLEAAVESYKKLILHALK